MESFEGLKKLVLSNTDARTAAKENSLRRDLARPIRLTMEKLDISTKDLAKMIGVSKTQVRRLQHKEGGGNLTLNIICRAADALGLVCELRLYDGTDSMEEVENK